MFREMRRKRQLLSKEDTQKILYQGTSGVLAVSGDDGYPYAVPLSYVYDGEKIYFHSAKSGHKLDAIVKNPKASFCVIDQDNIVPDEYTTYFRSVIVFGTIHILHDEADKEKPLKNWPGNMRLRTRKKIVKKRLRETGNRYVCWR